MRELTPDAAREAATVFVPLLGRIPREVTLMASHAEHPDSRHLEARTELATLLELSRPVSMAVVAGAACDPLYGHHLVASMGAPEFLDHLLANPPACSRDRSPTDAGFTTAQLVSGAVAALGRWARSGLQTVDEPTLARRLAACAACPYLIDPPPRLAYQVSALINTDNRVCGLCGCVAAKKAKLPTESCPGVDPNDSSRSRWGEARPMAASSP